MRFRRGRMMTGMLLVAVVAGCKQYDSPTTQTSPADPAKASARSTTSVATGAPGTAVPGGASDERAEAGAALGVGRSGVDGPHLVDAAGKTLYVLQADGAGASSCSDACTTKWPPLLAPPGTPKALNPSISSAAIAGIRRTDGTVQLAYRGHPLYRFAQDTAAGQVNGQGVKDQFGEWYMLDPSGKPVEGH